MRNKKMERWKDEKTLKSVPKRLSTIEQNEAG